MADAAQRRRRALWRLPFFAKILAKQPKLPKLDELIPADPRLATGVLPCGARYLVYANKKPRHRAALRLIVRIGSLVEEDDQLGIAHLMEHLVFRGTPSFPAGDLKKFIERCGMTWGADLNAETGMEQTSFTLEVPLVKTGLKLLKTGLTILREFAFEALLKSADVQVEKGIVEEEWRCRLGADQRVEDAFWKNVFGDCRHSKRLPIGSMEVLKACPRDRIAEFYRTWYRPENMGIVVVGDFGSNAKVVDMIKDIFSNLNPFPSPALALPAPALLATPRASVAFHDKELTSCQVRLRIFCAAKPRVTLRDICDSIALDLLLLAGNRRFQALQSRPGAPFISALLEEQHMSQDYRCIMITANSMQDSVRACVSAVAMTAMTLARHSMTASEVALAKKYHHKALESTWAERHHLETDEIAEACEDHFLSKCQSIFSSEAMDVRLQQEALELVDLQRENGAVKSLQAHAAELFGLSGGNWSIEAELPGDTDAALDSATLRALVLEAEHVDQDKIPPFVWESGEMLEGMEDDGAGQLDLASCDLEGSVLRQEPLEHMDGNHIVLANGATVTWMRTDFEPDEIIIHGTAIGGVSELSPQEGVAAFCLTTMRMLCGLGKLTKSQLGELLADKSASLLPAVSGYCRHLSGSSGASEKDFEMALRLAAWQFEAPNFTQSSFAKLVDLSRERIQNRERDPSYHLHKKIRELTQGDDRFFRELTVEDIDDMERLGLEGARSLYSRMFSNPGEWSWVIVGAIPNEDTFHKLVAKFLGRPRRTIDDKPFLGTSITPHLPIFTVGEVAQMHHGEADAASVCICFALDPSSFPRAFDRLSATCACEVAEARLLEQLRIVAGATYGVSCGPSYGVTELQNEDRRPVVSIEFGCEPSTVDKCIHTLFEQLNALVSGNAPITQDELDACKEKERERWLAGERENGTWQRRLALAVLKVTCGSVDEDTSPTCLPGKEISLPALRSTLKHIMERRQRIEDLTLTSLQQKVVCLFPPGQSVTVTLLPARLSPDVHVEDPQAKRQRTT